ncbi:8798_t:CDS:2, partial [Gigaspora margarita]
STEERNRTRPDDNQNDVTDSDIVPSAAFSEAMNHLGFVQTEVRQKLLLILDLRGQISRMQQYIDEQKNEIEELKKQLQRAHNNMIELRDLYDSQSKYNEALIEQWNTRFSDQQKRINAITEIAKAGCFQARLLIFACIAESFLSSTYPFNVKPANVERDTVLVPT